MIINKPKFYDFNVRYLLFPIIFFVFFKMIYRMPVFMKLGRRKLLNLNAHIKKHVNKSPFDFTPTLVIILKMIFF